ncbi:MAG: hypothetical protein CGU28_05700 [Candidatus Dactylopiibacterium carminicum]|uniref:ABC transporter substrate-binding protein n=1 Tax=Candidatus Dactylopiibacterium carminicum TaxID=857335 RepID=A0A272EUZ9_9RHOO|nr:ABC transporter substrate binding protein [Candidatus Dactylopiibacterium carminicum]KAF7599826.1 hypothetical protein BGI27_05745 [Candidatus Dactylopiibacterium carminicum]PAS93937.1 MAG: hypothetical protein CGU29_05750 [Candidatus Dactylopiibacterium carminicum]PAS97253.1 MAG: hypothetical protein CGU28_05700 [Candidatus Dactylopiibacterium carminicum]PAS99827.1 MAG: hypothetical protein BSR46_05775 [Candidatus Dactylopiibacterium carminicum]
MIRQFLAAVLIILPFASSVPTYAQDASQPAQQGFRILHIMSFNSPYRWTDAQLDGFKAGLGSDVKVEYKIYQLDTKRKSSPTEMAQTAREGRELVERWHPDLVFTSDDDALEMVARHFYNTRIPFVFSGVNKTASAHGLDNVQNVTGVLEREHILETIRLLQALKPGVKRIQVISDNAAYWPQVIGRIRILFREHPDLELAGVAQPITFAEFQHIALENPNQADANLMLGNFNFKDEKGADVPYPVLQRWYVENARLPDVSFWEDRMYHGTLAGVVVSGHEQGLAAGKLARARQLGITPRSTVLLSATVVTNFEWAK